MKSEVVEVTERQSQIIQLIIPPPFGKGLQLKQVAKILGISYSTAKHDTQMFRADFPKRWEAIMTLKQLAKDEKKWLRRIKTALNNPIKIGAIDMACVTPGTKFSQFDMGMDTSDLACYNNKIVSKMAYMKIVRQF